MCKPSQYAFGEMNPQAMVTHSFCSEIRAQYATSVDWMSTEPMVLQNIAGHAHDLLDDPQGVCFLTGASAVTFVALTHPEHEYWFVHNMCHAYASTTTGVGTCFCPQAPPSAPPAPSEPPAAVVVRWTRRLW